MVIVQKLHKHITVLSASTNTPLNLEKKKSSPGQSKIPLYSTANSIRPLNMFKTSHWKGPLEMKLDLRVHQAFTSSLTPTAIPHESWEPAPVTGSPWRGQH